MSAARKRRSWQRSYAKRLFFSDLIVIVFAVSLSQLLWIRQAGATLSFAGYDLRGFDVAYTAISALLIFVWMLSLDFFATRDHKNIGSGTTEYKRLIDATVRIFGLLALLAFLLKAELGRGYFLTALPVGLILLVGTRWSWRQWLRQKQLGGEYLSKALLIGHWKKTEMMASAIQRDGSTGLLAIGALAKATRVGTDLVPGVPILGSFEDAVRVIDETHVDTVVMTGADDISTKQMRTLGWELESRGVNLIVAPALTDVAGPRIHARPVAGLPLIHVDFPEFEGRKQVLKRAFDVFGSLFLLLLSSPVLLSVAIAVKFSSPGNVFYSQERVGLRGRPFGMLKFRSMVQGADDQLASLLDAQGTSDKPLFKVLNDPRITPIGKFIRKYSLDEFPQLVNVLKGDMSLVGPRPQRAAEVALYDDAAHRRLFMKPGMSGLWQVSGRSRLPWEDAIRLDLYYVENWSMTGDLIILWRTIRAVANADGAR